MGANRKSSTIDKDLAHGECRRARTVGDQSPGGDSQFPGEELRGGNGHGSRGILLDQANFRIHAGKDAGDGAIFSNDRGFRSQGSRGSH